MKRSPITRKTPLVPGTLRGLTNADLPQGVTFRRTSIKPRRKTKAKTVRPDPFAMLPKSMTYVSKRYRDWVASLTSCVSGLPAQVAHHIIDHGQGAMGAKASDLFVIPLTNIEHADLHRGVYTWESVHDSQWRYVAETLQRAILEGFKF